MLGGIIVIYYNLGNINVSSQLFAAPVVDPVHGEAHHDWVPCCHLFLLAGSLSLCPGIAFIEIYVQSNP